MVVNVLVTAVDMGKQRDVLFASFNLDVEKICGDDVEVLRVKVDKDFKICSADAVMAELENLLVS